MTQIKGMEGVTACTKPATAASPSLSQINAPAAVAIPLAREYGSALGNAVKFEAALDQAVDDINAEVTTGWLGR